MQTGTADAGERVTDYVADLRETVERAAAGARQVVPARDRRSPDRLGGDQPPALRPRAVPGRPRLPRLRAGRVGPRAGLPGRRLALAGRAVARTQPAPGARHGAHPRGDATARPRPPQPAPHRLADGARGPAGDARLLHARLRRAPQAPPAADPGGGRVARRATA